MCLLCFHLLGTIYFWISRIDLSLLALIDRPNAAEVVAPHCRIVICDLNHSTTLLLGDLADVCGNPELSRSLQGPASGGHRRLVQYLSMT